MPIFKNLANWLTRSMGGSLASPNAAMLESLGGYPSDAGEHVNEHTALNIAIVWDCISILVSDVATTPIYVYRRVPGKAQKNVAADSSLMWLLNEQPNPEMVRTSFMSCLMLQLCIHGNAYAQIEWNNANQPIGLWPLNAKTTRPIRDDNGNLFYETKDGVRPGDPIGFRYIPAEDVIHVPGILTYNGLLGISPIEHAKTSIGTAIALDKHAARFFGNGSQPGFLLSIQGESTPEQRQATVDSLRISTTGANQHKGLLLPDDFKFQQITIPNDQAQFLESRKFSVDEICRWYRIAPHLVGEVSKSTGSSMEALANQHFTQTLQIYFSKFEQEFKRKLTPKVGPAAYQYDVRFYTNEKLRGDTATRTAYVAAMRQNGVTTANECRLLEELNPVGPEGDVLTISNLFVNAAKLLDPTYQGGSSASDPLVSADLDEEEDETTGTAPGTKPLPAPDDDPTDEQPDDQRYSPLIQDAIKRYLSRSDKGAEAITKVFEPVFKLITTDSTTVANKRFTTQITVNSDKLVRDVAKSLLSRSEKWVTEEIDTTVKVETEKITRGIRLDVFRQAGAQIALEGINEE